MGIQTHNIKSLLPLIQWTRVISKNSQTHHKESVSQQPGS